MKTQDLLCHPKGFTVILFSPGISRHLHPPQEKHQEPCIPGGLAAWSRECPHLAFGYQDLQMMLENHKEPSAWNSCEVLGWKCCTNSEQLSH